MSYCIDPYFRKRLESIEVSIGDLKLGAKNPIRVQSMTTTDTMDTEGSIAQSIRMIDAGCELVRLTAPSKKEAENLAAIRNGLQEKGYTTPLVADIHFTPNAAEIAARIVEKVRVNPGNYADKKKFEEIEYTEESYAQELIRIEEKFTPLIKLCKENGTAMRIGTNHGSLSDRILSRYGDTAEGMVASAYEFIEICEKHDFHNLVISMKASNTLVMVHAYRMLCKEMLDRGRIYPLHLGVTEAGDGEDGRIKSAVGIGALLEDGIGDTVRVSLTEDPEFEIPVAQKLIAKYSTAHPIKTISPNRITFNPYAYEKRKSTSIENIGGKNHPIVIADYSKRHPIEPKNLYGIGYNYSEQLDKWNLSDLAADYLYIGDNTINFELPGTLRTIVDFENYTFVKTNSYPLVKTSEFLNSLDKLRSTAHFLQVTDPAELEKLVDYILPNTILVLKSDKHNATAIYRIFQFILSSNDLNNPIILNIHKELNDTESYQLHTAAEGGVQLIDGFGDGIWLSGPQSPALLNSTAFGILQATRTRISKTEYISCPSCGRTLFDLQETTAKIRTQTEHLKGIKIGIMGCIVNGPGEMADADYGYVGTGPGKINLYKEKEVIKRNVPEESAVAELINLIKEHGDWVEPKE